MKPLKKIQNHSIIVLLVLFLIFAATSVWALRNNNLQMIKLRNAVYVADKQNGDVEAALNNLRSFVYGHMNTNLRSGQNGSTNEPPIQLVNRFNRALEAEQARIAGSASANKVYVDAQSQCEIASLPLTARAQCVQDYVSTHGQGIPQLNLPPKELYTFDFVSPTWSWDFAGFMIVATLLVLSVLLGEVIYKIVVRTKK